jgi:hypothetical protein
MKLTPLTPAPRIPRVRVTLDIDVTDPAVLIRDAKRTAVPRAKRLFKVRATDLNSIERAVMEVLYDRLADANMPGVMVTDWGTPKTKSVRAFPF